MNRFKELKIWQDAIDIAVDTYKLTKTLPSDEKFGLVSQMNRSSVSISSNIAEGAGRNNKKEFRQFLGVAQGSACELESLLIVSQRLEFIPEKALAKTSQELLRLQNMVNKLINTL